MISLLLSRFVIILFGTLYPAYASYKAVRTKNVKEYVKWMMYWIVYAIFTCIEAFADLFISWLPFYYEVKIIIIIWLMLPATKGASLIYKKFIHPQLLKREEEIDQYIAKASDQGYSTLITIGSKSFNYATNVILATALKGQVAITEQMKKSYSLNDLSKDEDAAAEVVDGGADDDDYVDAGRRADNDDGVGGYDDDGLMVEEEDVQVRAKTKRTRSMKHHPDLEPLDEHTEVTVTRSRGRKKEKAYDHTEVYHMGTLPRPGRTARPALNMQE